MDFLPFFDIFLWTDCIVGDRFARRATSHRAALAARYIAWTSSTYRRPWYSHGLYRIAARQYIARCKAAYSSRHSATCKGRPQGDLSPRGIGRAVYRVGLAHISQVVVLPRPISHCRKAIYRTLQGSVPLRVTLSGAESRHKRIASKAVISAQSNLILP